MASPNIYTLGAGGTSGADMAVNSPQFLSGVFWYVSSTTGSDGAWGKERERPLATIAQAVTNSAAGDTIVFLSGHTETLTASQSIGKSGLQLVGEGTGSNRPKFTCNGAVVLFDLVAPGILLDNLYFPASTVAPTPYRVRMTTAGSHRVNNCYFECGALDTVEALNVGVSASNVRLSNTTFISTATAVTAQPKGGVAVDNAVTDLVVDACTFDGGTVGWSSFSFNASAAVTRLRINNTDLLNNSDLTVATGSVYTVHIRNKSGSARVVLTA